MAERMIDTSMLTAEADALRVKGISGDIEYKSNGFTDAIMAIPSAEEYEWDIYVPPGPVIVPWATGTDEQILAMVEALDAGTITVEDTGWQIGDERVVHLESFTHYPDGSAATQTAQDAVMVIMHRKSNGVCAGKQFTDGTVPNFIIGFKENLCASYWNPSNNVYNNSYLWKVEDNIYNVLPADLKPAFKQFKAITGIFSDSGSTYSTYNRYFASPAAREVFGGRDSAYEGNETGFSIKVEYTALGSNAQFDYYKDINHRKRSQYDSWTWERSPDCSLSDSACSISIDGIANSIDIDEPCGISPFGCI